MPGWHSTLCILFKDFSGGSDIDAAAALKKVSGAQLRLPGRYIQLLQCHKKRVISAILEFYCFLFWRMLQVEHK